MGEAASASKLLQQRLREADSRTLEGLVRQHLDELDVQGARQVLRNPFVTPEIIDLLLELKSLLNAYELRRDLALHPRTREVAALRFVPGLFWRDLARLGIDMRVRPKVRRAADRYLTMRLPSLTAGERISLGRIAGPGLLSQLLHEKDTRVFAALLQNPKLTEGLILPLVSKEGTPPQILDLVARSYRWGTRYAVRLALVRNPRTPTDRALAIVSALKKGDLRSLLKERRLPQAVRRRASLLLGHQSDS